MRKRKQIQQKDEEAEVNWKNGPHIWFPNTENFFRELIYLIRNAEQSRTRQTFIVVDY
jgi:hypothetical protein